MTTKTRRALCTLCDIRFAADIAKSGLCAECATQLARYPAAFHDDLSVWVVTRQRKPPPRWQKIPPTGDIDTTIVVAPDEQTAIVRGTTPGWLVLKARAKCIEIAIPTCTACGAGIDGASRTGLCRHCALKAAQAKAAAAVKTTHCIDCGKGLKGFSQSRRCVVCSSKATKNGTQRRIAGGKGETCIVCHRQPISPQSRTGCCRSCANSGRHCTACDAPLAQNGTSPHCRSCGQKEAARITVERQIRAKERAA